MTGAGLRFRRLGHQPSGKLHIRAFQSLPWERQEGCQRVGFKKLGWGNFRGADESIFESNR